MDTQNNLDWSDEKYCDMFRRYGRLSLETRQKCIGMLPEINRRKLYEKMGFDSIFECAAKIAGLSREQVFLAINLDKRFDDKPTLKAVLTNGEVSINKLARVVSIATAENEAELAEQVKLLSKSAVETLVRDLKAASIQKSEIQNGLFKTKIERIGLPGQTLQLSAEVNQKLLQLQRKGFDINELLLELLEEREQKINAEKKTIMEEMSEKVRVAQVASDTRQTTSKTTRYIPAKVKKILQKEYGTQCAIPTCQKPSEQLHHTDRFSIGNQHNPYYMAPLCKEHHTIAHSIDINVQERRKMALRW